VPSSDSLEKEVLNNHQQPVAANIHKFPLIRREEVGPRINPVCSHSNNLQKVEAILFVKDNIVPAIPYCPTHNRYTNADSSFSIPINPIKPITKHISNIRRWWDIIRKMDHMPNNANKRA
jgi:hypothetical protein